MRHSSTLPTKTQLLLWPGAELPPGQFQARSNGRANKLNYEDRAFHDWYRFVLSYPPHLVAHYIDDFKLTPDQVILDPFCGTGTTLVEAKLRCVPAVGLEANPFPRFASSVKVDWTVDPEDLVAWARRLAKVASETLVTQGFVDNAPFAGDLAHMPLRNLDPGTAGLLIQNSISPLPLHKTLILLDCLRQDEDTDYFKYGILALGKALVFSISNLHFGPEVGVGDIKRDSPVIHIWLSEVIRMANDLRGVVGCGYPRVAVHLADAREASQVLKPESIDAVITSPPYPNEKDYTRTTRLESAVLGFVTSKEQLRSLKRQLIRSNTRGVYKDDSDDAWVRSVPEVQRIAAEIERRRVEMGKTSGFEKLYGKVAQLYFGGMRRHLADLRTVLRPGAKLAYVVGDQASYLQVMIHTGTLLADIAQALGYKLVRVDPFRTRFATATKKQLREEIVLLRWPG